MWWIVNNTPFQADRAFARDQDGAEHWVVVVRMTYTFNDLGEVEPAPEQQPVRLAPEYFGEPGRSSLRYDTDIARAKTCTDIVLNATAYASGTQPMTDVDVGFSIGPVAKRLRIFGDRTWHRSLTGMSPSVAQPFRQQSIRYERAYGGAPAKDLDNPGDPRNPVGVGVPRQGAALPNVEYPDRRCGSREWRVPAAKVVPEVCIRPLFSGTGMAAAWDARGIGTP